MRRGGEGWRGKFCERLKDLIDKNVAFANKIKYASCIFMRKVLFEGKEGHLVYRRKSPFLRNLLIATYLFPLPHDFQVCRMLFNLLVLCGTLPE